jgi:hypothetical protein
VVQECRHAAPCCSLTGGGARAPPPPLPFPRTNWTSLVPPLVLIGHAASLTLQVTYLDDDLCIHRAGDGSLFVLQRK